MLIFSLSNTYYCFWLSTGKKNCSSAKRWPTCSIQSWFAKSFAPWTHFYWWDRNSCCFSTVSQSRLFVRKRLVLYKTFFPLVHYLFSDLIFLQNGSTKTWNPESGNGNGINNRTITKFRLHNLSTIQRHFVIVCLCSLEFVTYRDGTVSFIMCCIMGKASKIQETVKNILRYYTLSCPIRYICYSNGRVQSCGCLLITRIRDILTWLFSRTLLYGCCRLYETCQTGLLNKSNLFRVFVGTPRLYSSMRSSIVCQENGDGMRLTMIFLFLRKTDR